MCGYGYSQRRVGEVCGNRAGLAQLEIGRAVCVGRLVTPREYMVLYKDEVDERRRRRRADRDMQQHPGPHGGARP